MIESLSLELDLLHDHDDWDWDKVGQAIGNLQAVVELYISHLPSDDSDHNERVAHIPDWEILGCILSHVRQRIKFVIAVSAWGAKEIRSLARAIHGHPTIRHFEGDQYFPEEYMDMLYSELATLPALESILFSTGSGGLHTRPEDAITLASHAASLTELLRVPSLRALMRKQQQMVNESDCQQWRWKTGESHRTHVQRIYHETRIVSIQPTKICVAVYPI